MKTVFPSISATNLFAYVLWSGIFCGKGAEAVAADRKVARANGGVAAAFKVAQLGGLVVKLGVAATTAGHAAQ